LPICYLTFRLNGRIIYSQHVRRSPSNHS